MYNGKHLNSPNDMVPYPDGSSWFTDPPYGGQLSEGTPDVPGGPTNPVGRFKNRLGQPPEAANLKRELPTNVYRADPSGRLDLVIGEDQLPNPNGLAFSPDYKRQTREEWAVILDRMITYGMPMLPGDRDIILEYLATRLDQ